MICTVYSKFEMYIRKIIHRDVDCRILSINERKYRLYVYVKNILRVKV